MKKKVNLITAITATFVVIALALASCAPIPNITSGSGGGTSPNGTSSGGGSSEWGGGTSSNKSSVSITVKSVGASSIRAIPSGDVDRLRSETAKYRIIFRNAGATRTRETTGGTVSELFEVGTEVRITVECLNSKNQVIVRSIEKAVTVGGGTKSVAFKLSEDGEEIVPTDDGQTDPDEGGGDTPGSDTPGGDTPAPNPPAPVEYVNITFKQGFILTDNQGQLEWRPFTGAYLPQDGDKQKGANVERPEAPEEYSFKGWIEGDQAPQTGGLPSSYVTKYTRDMTLSAIWEGSAAVMFDPGNTGFQNQTAPAWESLVYVEKGTQYTLPDYGTYQPAGSSVPKKHIGWSYYESGVSMTINPGEPVTITGNITFTLVAEDFATISFQTYNFGKQIPTEYWEKNTYYTLTDYGISDTGAAAPNKHTGWSYTDSTGNQQVGLTARVLITGDTQFTLEYVESIPLTINKATDITLLDNSIYKDDANSLYFVWPNQPFTLPKAKKQDGSEVTEWTYSNDLPPSQSSGSPVMISGVPGTQVQYNSDWLNTACNALVIEPDNQ